MTEEAYELVEKGVFTEEHFRNFMFVNPVKLWTDMRMAREVFPHMQR